MPRPLRIEFQDAWYHVMNRGAGYKKIYKTLQHRALFLEILSEATILFGIEIHAYCLMDNHYHLLIKTPRGNLSQAMRHINGVYTQRYNRLVKTDGPLFRGRYKALIVEKDAYLLQVSRYIHLNPVVAKIIKTPEQYQWSSYLYYLKKQPIPTWLKTTEVLSMIEQKKKSDSILYKQFVEDGLDTEIKTFYAKINMPTILGTSTFKEKLLGSLDKETIKASMTDYNYTRPLPSPADIDQAVSQYFQIDKKSLYQGIRGQKNEQRLIAIYGCRMWCYEKLSVIANRYGCNSHGYISNAVQNVRQQIEVDKRFARIINKINHMVFHK